MINLKNNSAVYILYIVVNYLLYDSSTAIV